MNTVWGRAWQARGVAACARTGGGGRCKYRKRRTWAAYIVAVVNVVVNDRALNALGEEKQRNRLSDTRVLGNEGWEGSTVRWEGAFASIRGESLQRMRSTRRYFLSKGPV